jgi:hypothetical protein
VQAVKYSNKIRRRQLIICALVTFVLCAVAIPLGIKLH